MPTYDFQCTACGQRFEARLTMAAYSAGTRPSCPGCGSPRPARSFRASINVATGRSGLASSRDFSSCETPPGGCGTGSCGCG